MTDSKKEVSLPQGAPSPYIHPGAPQHAVDQAAVFEAAKNARRIANSPPKTDTPVAGGRPPPIPHLAGSPQHGGMTMAQHAMSERRVAPEAALAPQSVGFVQPAERSVGPNQVPSSPAQMGILPTDELPKEATEDPAFIKGTGSMFAASQPNLAMKYGVIRKGKHVAPQAIGQRTQPSKLSAESIRDLEELQRLERNQGGVVPEPPSSEMGMAAGSVGVPPANKVLSEEDKSEIKEAVKSLDEFDFDRWRQSMMRDVINNEGQKSLIESRLTEMDVGDLVTQGYIIQRVPIIPGKFIVDFKTCDGEADLAIKRIIMEDSASVDVSDRYFLDKFGLMSLAAVIHKINDRPFGDFVNEHGDFDDDKFRAKFRKVVKLPMPMLASLGANALWFDVRVRKLFVAEKLGNG